MPTLIRIEDFPTAKVHSGRRGAVPRDLQREGTTGARPGRPRGPAQGRALPEQAQASQLHGPTEWSDGGGGAFGAIVESSLSCNR